MNRACTCADVFNCQSRMTTEQACARFQLLQKNGEILQAIPPVSAGSVQHEHEHTCALDVAQEQVTKAFVLMSALYDARQISNRE